MSTVHTILTKHQVRWVVHLVQIPDECIPKQLFYGKLLAGKQAHGSQCKCFKDTLKVSPKALKIDPTSWDHAALHCTFWHSLNTRKVAVAEERWDKVDTPPTKSKSGKHLHYSSFSPMAYLWQAPPCSDWIVQSSKDAPTSNITQLGCHWSSSPMMDAHILSSAKIMFCMAEKTLPVDGFAIQLSYSPLRFNFTYKPYYSSVDARVLYYISEGILVVIHSKYPAKRAQSFSCSFLVCLELQINFSMYKIYLTQHFQDTLGIQ